MQKIAINASIEGLVVTKQLLESKKFTKRYDEYKRKIKLRKKQIVLIQLSWL